MEKSVQYFHKKSTHGSCFLFHIIKTRRVTLINQSAPLEKTKLPPQTTASIAAVAARADPERRESKVAKLGRARPAGAAGSLFAYWAGSGLDGLV